MRKEVGEVVKQVYQRLYPRNDVSKAVYIEGVPPLLSKRGIPHYKLFGSTGQYPDLAILEPFRLAIELDHTEKSVGSKLKSVLSKSAFNCLSGDWDACIQLFCVQGKTRLVLEGEKEKAILELYERFPFYTKLRVFQ